MTQLGRPSAACSPCRARRIKCDKAKPVCSQCARVGSACTGYRDPLDQNFRDESDKVVRRAQKSYHKPTNPAGPAQTSACRQLNPAFAPGEAAMATATLSFCDNKPASPRSLQQCLSIPVEDFAITYFMTSFAPSSRFKYIPHVYTKSAANRAFDTSVRAASMAFLFQEAGQSIAHRYYNEALTAMNATLSDPAAATTDATLASILLLSLFEAIMPARKIRSWKAHAQGALTLLKLRGMQQLDTPVGRELFVQAFNMICVACIQEASPVPAEAVDFIQNMTQKEGNTIPAHLAKLTRESSYLRAAVAKDSMAAQDIIERSLRLDEQYISFMHRLALENPRSSLFVPEKSPRPDDGLPLHAYSDYRTTQMGNTARLMRKLLNEAIYALANQLDAALAAPIQAQALRNVHQILGEICESVPHWDSSSTTRRSEGHFPAVVERGKPFWFKPSVASFLLPLSVVVDSRLATESLKACALEKLKALGVETAACGSQGVPVQTPGFQAFQNRLYMFYTL